MSELLANIVSIYHRYWILIDKPPIFYHKNNDAKDENSYLTTKINYRQARDKHSSSNDWNDWFSFQDAWYEDLEEILKGSPVEKQVILFSATMPREIYQVAENFLQRELEVIRVKDVESEDNAPSAVNHLSLYVPKRDQTKTIKEIISLYQPKSAIVFVATR